MGFTRTIEHFTCENCGTRVEGNGYTNHCPACLWSKHVDINPGDRAAACGGMMEPIAIEGSTAASYRIRQRCVNCTHEFLVSSASADSAATMESIAKKRSL